MVQPTDLDYMQAPINTSAVSLDACALFSLHLIYSVWVLFVAVSEMVSPAGAARRIPVFLVGASCISAGAGC